ncbi:MAG TPA: hypothetical protein PKX92_05640 [Edaphocola sp.]|nr:hypothetical protein [Edaphocola sp.]
MVRYVIFVMLFWCLHFLQIGNSNAQDTALMRGFKGTIGVYPILMTIGFSDDQPVNSNYCYTKYAKDIKITHYFSKNKIILKVNEESLHNYETFELTFKDKNTLEGIWKTPKKTLPVKLVEISEKDIASIMQNQNLQTYLQKTEHSLSAYELEKLNSIHFKKEYTKKYKGKEIIWLFDPKSELRFFRLGQGFSDKEKAAMNPVLEQIHLDEAMAILSADIYTSNSYYNVEDVQITFLSEKLLGFKINRAWDGGAYPDFSTIGYLYQLESGYAYDLDDVFNFGDRHTKENEKKFDEWSDYRIQQMAPIVYGLVQYYHDKEIEEDEQCVDVYDYNMEWAFADWYFTENGVVFIPSLPHVVAICRVPFEIPYDALQDYFTSGFKVK